MSELLDFSGAKLAEGNKYLEPGVHTVKVIKVEGGKSKSKGSPYVEITVENQEKLACSHQYYLNGGAFNISRDAIVQLIVAALNTDEATAKTKLVGADIDNLPSKLASVLIGKPFGIRLAGEWITPTDTQKKPWVKSEFGNYKFAVPLTRIAELKHDPAKHIKGTPAPTAEGNNSADNGGVVTEPTKTANW